jgi:hypothetical protein
VLEVLTAAAAERLQEMGPVGLSRVVVGFRDMGYQPGSEWLVKHQRAVMGQLRDFWFVSLNKVLEGYEGLGFEADPRVQARLRQLGWLEQQELRRQEVEKQRQEEKHVQKEKRRERKRAEREELSYLRQQEQLDLKIRAQREERLRAAEEHQQQHRQMQVQRQGTRVQPQKQNLPP